MRHNYRDCRRGHRLRKSIAAEQAVPYAGSLGEKLLAIILVAMGLFLVVYVGQQLVAFA